MNRSQLVFAALLFGINTGFADSTIDPDPQNRHAYAANAGWINFNWDSGAPNGGNGAVVTEHFLAGKVYAANFGWIDLGDGSPQNGIQYQNTIVDSENDFGVNHDGTGALTGFAYGANIGWIRFAQSWNHPPTIDLLSGRFSGYAYSASLGWIDLGQNGLVGIVTTSIAIGPDIDGDGLSDAWELAKVAAAGLSSGTIASDLTFLGGGANDADGDTRTDTEEFNADTNPFDDSVFLQITLVTIAPASPTDNVEVTWTSTPTRIYDLQGSPNPLIPFGDVTTDIPGAVGSAETTLLLTEPLPFPDRLFFRVGAKRPLAP